MPPEALSVTLLQHLMSNMFRCRPGLMQAAGLVGIWDILTAVKTSGLNGQHEASRRKEIRKHELDHRSWRGGVRVRLMATPLVIYQIQSDD